jgi:hypothetical protein
MSASSRAGGIIVKRNRAFPALPTIVARPAGPSDRATRRASRRGDGLQAKLFPPQQHPLLVFERPPVKNVGWPGLARSVKVTAIGCTIKPSSGDAGRGNAIARVNRTFCALEAVVGDTIDFFSILLLVFTCLLRDRASDPEVLPICLPSTQPQ